MKEFAQCVWRLRYLLVILPALATVRAISQESGPNLSGIWRWNPDKSHVSGPPASNRRVKIEQQGSDIAITVRVVYRIGEEFRKYHFTIGSDDNTNELMGFPLKSTVHWKDGALTVDSTAATDDGELHMADTWTLSADGQTLTFHQNRTVGDRPPAEDLIVYEKQPEADWEPPQPPKPAEEVFKNIQVLKGVPAPQLMAAMRSFSHSLGVKCDFCHVPPAFEKDDKPEKQTARKMIQMAHQINADNFGGHMRVTCWTCHRGAAEPPSSAK